LPEIPEVKTNMNENALFKTNENQKKIE